MAIMAIPAAAAASGAGAAAGGSLLSGLSAAQMAGLFAGLQLAKSEFIDRPQKEKEQELAALETELSPFGIKRSTKFSLDDTAGKTLQAAMLGLQFGQAMDKAGMQKKFQEAQMNYINKAAQKLGEGVKQNPQILGLGTSDTGYMPNPSMSPGDFSLSIKPPPAMPNFNFGQNERLQGDVFLGPTQMQRMPQMINFGN